MLRHDIDDSDMLCDTLVCRLSYTLLRKVGLVQQSLVSEVWIHVHLLMQQMPAGHRHTVCTSVPSHGP